MGSAQSRDLPPSGQNAFRAGELAHHFRQPSRRLGFVPGKPIFRLALNRIAGLFTDIYSAVIRSPLRSREDRLSAQTIAKSMCVPIVNQGACGDRGWDLVTGRSYSRGQLPGDVGPVVVDFTIYCGFFGSKMGHWQLGTGHSRSTLK